MKQLPHRQNLGNYGETIAAEYLTKHGYILIDRNFKARYGEIDLITLQKNTLIFIEVKTRLGNTYGTPEDAVTPRKIHEVVITAQYYILLHPELPTSQRIDVIALELNSDRTIRDLRHIKNITQ